MSNDNQHPFFRPLWIRILVVAICGLVAAWDLYNGDYVWALIFGGLSGYAVYVFFVAWGKDQSGEDTGKKP